MDYHWALLAKAVNAGFSLYNFLNKRERIVRRSIDALFKQSFESISESSRHRIRTAILKWTGSKEFLTYWVDSLTAGNFEASLAYKSFSSVTCYYSTIESVDVEAELIPLFIHHLQSRRLNMDTEFKAYRESRSGYEFPRQSQMSPAIGKRIRLLERRAKVPSTEWQSWYQVLQDTEKLIEKRQLNLALEELEKLVNHSDFARAPVDLKVSLLKAIGLTQMELKNFESSSLRFRDAQKLKPTDGEILAYLAQNSTSVQTGNNQEALVLAEQALALDIANEVVVSTYLFVCGQNDMQTEGYAFLSANPQWLNNRAVLVALGHNMAFEFDFRLAQQYYEKALEYESSQDDLQIQFLISSCKLIQMQQSQSYSRNFVKPDDVDQSFELRDLLLSLEQQLERRRTSDTPQDINKCIQALAAAHALNDDWKSVLQCIQAWHIEGDQLNIDQTRVLALVNLERISEAKEFLESHKLEFSKNIDICRFMVAKVEERWDECLTLLERIPSYKELGQEEEITNYTGRARILFRLERLKEALSIVEYLLQKYPCSEMARMECSLALIDIGEISRAKELIESAQISDEDDRSIKLALSAKYCETAGWLQAVATLRQIENIDSNEEALTQLIYCQVNAGLNHAACVNARKLRFLAGGPVDGITLHVELQNYFYRLSWDDALDLIVELRLVMPDDPSLPVYEAIVQIRGFKNKQAAQMALLGIDKSSLSNSLQQELHLLGL